MGEGVDRMLIVWNFPFTTCGNPSRKRHIPRKELIITVNNRLLIYIMIQVYHDIPYIYIHRYIMIYLMYTYIPMSMLQTLISSRCWMNPMISPTLLSSLSTESFKWTLLTPSVVTGCTETVVRTCFSVSSRREETEKLRTEMCAT